MQTKDVASALAQLKPWRKESEFTESEWETILAAHKRGVSTGAIYEAVTPLMSKASFVSALHKRKKKERLAATS